MNVWTHSQLIRERYKQPIEVDGRIYYPTTTAAAQLGITPWWLSTAAKGVPGDDVVLVAANGLRFIRKPRHRGDMKSPLYWCLEVNYD